MACASRSFFSVKSYEDHRVTMAGLWNEEIKRTAELGLDVLHRLMAQASKFSKKNSILNTVRKGEMAKVSRKLSRRCCTRGTQSISRVSGNSTQWPWD